MGLSRKLGGGTSSRSLESPGHVDYTWSTQAYTIRDILTRFQLPCVVQCSGDAGTVLWADFRFDMRQPLLLHAARTVRKIHARSLKSGQQPGELEEYGPPLAIPEDYDGWFFPVGRKDPTAIPRHTRVESVATSPTQQFLVTTTLPAFAPAEGASAGGAKHVEHEVSIGEVLTKVGVVKGEPSVTSSPSALIQRSRQSLRCLDENHHEVIIPFHHRSLLYDVAENYSHAPSNAATCAGEVQQISGVIHTSTMITAGNKCLPRIFRHVLGELPALAHAFTGILRCYSVFTEETVMAATMSQMNFTSMFQESSCLELATDSSAKFKIALNASELKKTNQYALALKTCEEQAPSYVRAIKTSFTVHPEVLQQEDADLSGDEFDQTDRVHISQADVRMIHEALQGRVASTAPMNSDCEDSADVVYLDSQSEVTDTCDDESEGVNTCDNESLVTDCVHDDESVMTDDVPHSNMDTTSLSDTTDIMFSDCVSDVVEVEANSEFDFSWGQLKRAKSFSGSISTLSDDSGTRTPSSDSSEDSIVIHSHLDSSVSHDSTLTKRTNSSTSEDTVVLRASAPSPIYANVPKKLSVFTTEQDAVSDNESQTDTSSSARVNTDVRNADNVVLDTTVRSVWNVTPTVEDTGLSACGCAEDGCSVSQDTRQTVGNNEGSDTGPIWWGDGMDSGSNLSLNSMDSVQGVQKQTLGASGNIDTLAPGQFSDMTASSISHINHPQLLAKSSNSSQSTVITHALLSAQSSVHSEGSAQDLAIQRLEQALNEATNFLKSSSPSVMGPVPQPRAQRSVTADSLPTSDFHSDPNNRPDSPQQDISHTELRNTAAPVVLPQRNATPRNFPTGYKSSSELSWNKSLLDDHVQAQFIQNFGCEPHRNTTYQSELQLDRDHCAQAQVHYQSDSQLKADHCAQSEGQTDVDFVKTLGDKLMAVSKKSSFPKYQRLYPESDVQNDGPEREDWHQQPRKRRQKNEYGDEHKKYDADNIALNEDWDNVDSLQTEAILDDFDLLEEEIV